MTPGRLVRINRADVTCEVFDDEVVLINFRSGSYFSVGGSGREIVQELAGRDATVVELVRLVETCFTGEASSMTSVTETFLADLERAGLVTVTDGEAPEPSADPASESKAEDVPGRRPFEPPVFRAYDDMQALLLLDPIHEVDETGWPNVKPAPPGTRE